VALSITQLPLLLSTPQTKFYTGIFYLFALGGAAISVLACLGPFVLRGTSFRSLLNRIPFIHHGAPLIAAYEKTAQALGTNIQALLISLPSHLSSAVVGYCLLSAMHLHVSLVPFCAVLAMVNMLIALPITISGFGLRVWLFGTFLGLLHIDWNHAIAFSLTNFAITLLWSLVGGPFYFLYRHETHTPPPDVAEVEPIFSER
jgi:hypothetical protein